MSDMGDETDEDKTISVEWSISTGFVGAKHKGVWENLPADISDEELDEMLQEELANHIDCGWKRL